MEDKKLVSHIEASVLKRLDLYRLDLSHLWLLEMFFYDLFGEEDSWVVKDAHYLTLVRKGFIVDRKITEEGKELYQSLTSIELKEENIPVKEDKIQTIRDKKQKQFEEWWTTFPSMDRVKDNNNKVIFKETRSLRNNKEYCKNKYIEFLNTYSHEDLIGALKYEVDFRVKQSLEPGAHNKLTFMQNTKTYLFNRSFESFLESYKEEQKDNKPTTFHI